MRDYRDAKTMAKTLRQSLKARSFTVTHAESLELTAQAFGFRDWNGLAARIEAGRLAPTSSGLMRCSFCGKSQQDVGVLIAGPGSAICNACVDLCDDVLLFEQAPPTPGAAPREPPTPEALAQCTPERLIQLKTRAQASIDNGRRLLALIASGDFAPRGDARSDPQRTFIGRKSTAERQSYADDIVRRMSALEGMIKTVTDLIDRPPASA